MNNNFQKIQHSVFSIRPETEYFQVFGFWLLSNVKMQICSFTAFLHFLDWRQRHPWGSGIPSRCPWFGTELLCVGFCNVQFASVFLISLPMRTWQNKTNENTNLCCSKCKLDQIIDKIFLSWSIDTFFHHLSKVTRKFQVSSYVLFWWMERLGEQ